MRVNFGVYQVDQAKFHLWKVCTIEFRLRSQSSTYLLTNDVVVVVNVNVNVNRGFI